MSEQYSELEEQQSNGISGISVAGFKSINEEQSIEVRPLTILAGANSSGKSSIIQPLLLLKQTLEATYDPGALKLDGPNIKFTSPDQLLTINGKGRHAEAFQMGINYWDDVVINLIYQAKPNESGFDINQMNWVVNKRSFTLRLDMSQAELDQLMSRENLGGSGDFEWFVERDRSFLTMYLVPSNKKERPVYNPTLPIILVSISLIKKAIQEIIHLPGLRGNPERAYPTAAVSATFPGTFEYYTASVIVSWQESSNQDKLDKLNDYLKKLGLTSKVVAKRLDATRIELQVSRLLKSSNGKNGDMVNIADVGLGVSQVLPVLVALLVAVPGQLVYIDQPELHLHPRAQNALAEILADAAGRGVRVVIETHSEILLLGIQTLVAESKLAAELVKLHWFERVNGVTKISSADLDESGAFGDWPEDFADVSLRAESRYLDAAELKLRKNKLASNNR